MTVIWGTRARLSDWNIVNRNPPKQLIDVVSLFGKQCVKSELTTDEGARADCGRYTDVGQVTDGWFGWNLYFKTDFKVNSNAHCTVAQLHCGKASGKFFTLVARMDDTFQIRRDIDPHGRVIVEEGIPQPKGKWFPLIVHLVVARNGLIDVLVDGNHVSSYSGDTRSQSPGKGGRPGASIIAGLYQGEGVGPNKMYFKDVVCATTKAEVDAFLATEPPPPPPPQFCCDICGECFPTQGELDEHMKGHEVPPIERGCITSFLFCLMGLSTLLPWIRRFRSHLPQLMIRAYYGLSGFMLQGLG